MGLAQDWTALLAQVQRPRYGRSLVLAGAALPKPRRERVPTRHGRVRTLVYAGTRAGRYVHFHGGAFVTRYPRMDDFWARWVVSATGLSVVLPDYDVAPQARFPVAHDQALDVLVSLSRAGGPLVVGGFSGGGNLAASAALRAGGDGVPLAGQLLAVPSLDVQEAPAEKCARAPQSMITPRLLNLVRAVYFTDEAARGGPIASPLLAVSVSGAPPALVVTAERDALRREGERYAARLAADGVPVEHVLAPGVDHYFLHGAGEQQARGLMTRMSNWLSSVTGG